MQYIFITVSYSSCMGNNKILECLIHTLGRRNSLSIAIVKDVSLFLQKIARMRNLSLNNAVYQVCQDGGGGSFKRVVSVMENGASPSTEPRLRWRSCQGLTGCLFSHCALVSQRRTVTLGKSLSTYSFTRFPILKLSGVCACSMQCWVSVLMGGSSLALGAMVLCSTF